MGFLVFAPGMQVNASVRLVRPLGAGGMGLVWIADHLALHTQVVVKFIASDAPSEAAVTRFSREARAAAAVKSPHVVQMFDHGVTAEGAPYIVMELLTGEDVRERLSRGPLAPAELALILEHVCKALSRAHAAGIVHRDIKPDNIFLCATDDGAPFVKLLDFGIAKGAADGVAATKTGGAPGTLYYMSPEQITDPKSVDARSDLWSLGVVAFEALVGARPFDGESLGALVLAITSGPLPVPSEVNAALSKDFDRWFARACARDRGQRFTTAKEMVDAFPKSAVRTPDVDPLGRTAEGPIGETEPKPSPSAAKPATPKLAAVAKRTSLLWRVGASVGVLGLMIFGASRLFPIAPPPAARAVSQPSASGSSVLVVPAGPNGDLSGETVWTCAQRATSGAAKLRVAVASEVALIVRDVLCEYQQANERDVDFDIHAFGSHAYELAHAKMGKPGTFDIVLLDDVWLPEMMAAGRLYDLRSFPGAEKMLRPSETGFYGNLEHWGVDPASDGGTQRLLAVPFVGNVLLLITRGSSDAGRFPFSDVGMRFDTANNVVEIFFEAMRAVDVDAGPQTLPEAVAPDGTLRLSRARADAAVKWMWRVSRPQLSEMRDEVEAARDLCDDKFPAVIGWPLWIYAPDSCLRPLAERRELSLHPVSANPVLGTWYLAVPADAQNAPMAAQVVAALATDQAWQQRIAAHGLVPVGRVEAANVMKHPFFSSHDNYAVLRHALEKTAFPRPRTARWVEIERKLGAAIVDALSASDINGAHLAPQPHEWVLE